MAAASRARLHRLVDGLAHRVAVAIGRVVHVIPRPPKSTEPRLGARTAGPDRGALGPDSGRGESERRAADARTFRGSWRALVPDDRSLTDELIAERRAEAALEAAEADGDAAAIDRAHAALGRAEHP